MTDTSLRERSKARRRAAIERAAWELFAERGYEATTIPDIAELAEVAPRTVTLYFPNKADLVLGHVRSAAGRREEALAAGQDTIEALRAWLVAEFEAVDGPTAAALCRVFAANPLLRGLQTVELAGAVERGRRALARELGLSDGALVVQLLTGAIVGALSAAIDARAAGHDVAEVTETALRVVRATVKAGAPPRRTAAR